MEAAGAGPDRAWIDAEEDLVFAAVLPHPLVPGSLGGPGCAAARALGGMELGGRGRPQLWDALGGRILILWEPPGGRVCRRLV